LKVSLVPHEKRQGAALLIDELSHSWLGAVKLAIAIGIAYFLAAGFGLALRVEVGVVFFWPAAGIAVGALIALGPNARLPVVAGVIISMVASILMMDRSPWLAIALGLTTAGEALLTAWLIEIWFNGVFKLEDVPQVLGFLVASALAAAIGTAGAATAIRFVEPTTFPPDVWRLWFASCSLGIITVAPVLIGLGQALHDPPPRRELTEGAAGLAILAGLSIFFVSRPPEPWATELPVLFVIPILLWVAVRCRPVFAAAAMVVVTLAVALSITFNLGHSGDTVIQLVDSIRATQTLVLAGALLALFLAALFSERRRSEAALKSSKERLRLVLDGAELGAFSADLITGRLECDVRAAQLHGHNVAPRTIKESRRFVCSDDLVRIDAALAAAKRSGGRWNAEYRVLPPADRVHAGETRWIAVERAIARDCQGTPTRLLGVTRDITERKRAEQDRQRLAAIVASSDDAIISTDLDGIVTSWNPGAEQLFGYAAKEMIGKSITLQIPAYLQHEESTLLRRLAGDERIEHFATTRVRKDGTLVRVSLSLSPIRNVQGSVFGVSTIARDITEREKAEWALAQRTLQLALAEKAALVGSYAYESDLETMSVSEGYCAMHGLPEMTTQSTRSQWRARVHPDDLERLEDHRARTFADKRDVLNLEYRIVRAGGEVRWIESRSIVFYDSDGQPHRVTGINIDVTERKQTETRLSNALAAGQVVAFEWDAATGRSQRSDNADRIMGLVDGSHFFRRVHPDDRDGFRSHIRNLSPDNPAYASTFRFICSDSRQVWLDETAKGGLMRRGGCCTSRV
jgi:PAS domain S-box-containing protein